MYSVRTICTCGGVALARIDKDLGQPTENFTSSFTRWLKPVEIGPRLREEILALMLITIAVIIALPMIGLADGTALYYSTSGLRNLFGLAAFAAPFAISIIAVEVWIAGEAQQRARRTVGGVLFVVTAIGLLTLSYPLADRSDAGGFAGQGVAYVLKLIFGEIGAALLLFSVGIVSVFLVTGNDIRSLSASWARIRFRHQRSKNQSDGQIDADEYEFDETAAIDASSGEYRTDETPDDATGGIDELFVDTSTNYHTPVISIPEQQSKSDKAAEEIQQAVMSISEEFDQQAEPADKKGWSLPPIKLLHRYSAIKPDERGLEEKARLIEAKLETFRVEARVREIFPGPAVTLFAVEPGVGVKVSKITSLQNDLALALAAPAIRIEAPVPGMARVGIEVPNRDIATVGLREVLESNDVKNNKAKLPLPLGRDVNGKYIVADLTRMPHLLIAGATGSGKSVSLNTIIATFLLTQLPEDLRLVMIDPKMVELVGFKNVPHLQGPIVTEMDKVVSALRLVLREMEKRYKRFVELGVRNINGYNLRREADPSLEKMPYLVVIIDELADLMMTTPDEVETLLARLCQMARATGIHMIIATQRPSVDVLTGLIKANVQARISFSVASMTDSRVILDMPGAENLLGSGDMLFLAPDAAKPQRIQGSFIDDRDLQRIVSHWRKQIPKVLFDEEWAEYESQDEIDAEQDKLYDQALEIVQQQGSASASMLQRRLRIGYNRAARIIEYMESEGLIGPAEGSRGRTVLINDDLN